jgi:hypothetical protein
MILTGKLVLYTRILVLCILLALCAVLWYVSFVLRTHGSPLARLAISDNLIRDGFCESREECSKLLPSTTTGSKGPIVGLTFYEVVGENERVFSAIVGYYAIAASSGGHRGGRIKISAYRETHDEYLDSYRHDDRRGPKPFLTLEIKE